MKINKNDLTNIIRKVISENVFEIDPNDSDMQQKISKIKNDTSLYDSNEDEIKIGDNTNESTYKKSDVLRLMGENKKKIGNNEDYLKAIKKADRELDYEMNGPGWKSKSKPHKNKTKYNRKDKEYLNDSLNESILSKKDVINLILEKKYNGKVYTKSELLGDVNE